MKMKGPPNNILITKYFVKKFLYYVSIMRGLKYFVKTFYITSLYIRSQLYIIPKTPWIPMKYAPDHDVSVACVFDTSNHRRTA
jgi:hypothetical protein